MLFRPATPADQAGLAGLFSALATAGDGRLFHPHPLTHEAARTVCGLRAAAPDDMTCDEYHVALDDASLGTADAAPISGPTIVGYGILRGWAEGFAVPSLGIAVHPAHRGRGIARELMAHLHRVAAARGAATIRLKVYRHNTAALRLYESLGYDFQPHSATELVGLRAIVSRVAA